MFGKRIPDKIVRKQVMTRINSTINSNILTFVAALFAFLDVELVDPFLCHPIRQMNVMSNRIPVRHGHRLSGVHYPTLKPLTAKVACVVPISSSLRPSVLVGQVPLRFPLKKKYSFFVNPVNKVESIETHMLIAPQLVKIAWSMTCNE